MRKSKVAEIVGWVSSVLTLAIVATWIPNIPGPRADIFEQTAAWAWQPIALLAVVILGSIGIAAFAVSWILGKQGTIPRPAVADLPILPHRVP